MSDLELKWMTEKILNGEKRQLTSAEQQQIEAWLLRRQNGEPLAYIIGEKGFYKNMFSVGPGVLIPRPETEFVVESALELFSEQGPNSFVEFGFGSGCIGLSLLKEWPEAKLIAVEKSTEALPWAEKNIQQLNLTDRTTLLNQAVETVDIKSIGNKKVSLVVSNPPYIAEEDQDVEANVKKYEPHLALYSGFSGLDCLTSFSEKACEILEDKGYLIFEIGSGQTKDVCDIIEHKGFTLIKIVKDYAGHDRVIVAQKR